MKWKCNELRKVRRAYEKAMLKVQHAIEELDEIGNPEELPASVQAAFDEMDVLDRNNTFSTAAANAIIAIRASLEGGET